MAIPYNIRFATQDKWHRLTPLEPSEDMIFPCGQIHKAWRFRCDCGTEKVLRASDVAQGKTRSCGCFSREVRGQTTRTHGATRPDGQHDPAYRSWRNMLTRGRNPNISYAAHYVLRGITVHADWQSGGDGKGYERFLAHVGPRPSAKHSLDRIDNDKGYEPGNVRWASQKEQMRNNSRNTFVTYQGKQIPITEAAELVGIKAAVIRDRIRLGWPPERLFDGRARAEFGRGPCSRPGVKPRS